MGYTSRRGKRPQEYASKSAHSHVIKDVSVQEFLGKCNLPKLSDDVLVDDQQLYQFAPVGNPIQHFIAIDGGYTEVAVRTEFPSATVCFFQIGALIFDASDLERLGAQPFIDPDDMAQLKRIQRLKFTMPVRNVTLRTEATITASVRRAIFDFFRNSMDDGTLIDTLCWFVFEEYEKGVPQWTLASCPICGARQVALRRKDMSKQYTFRCDSCGGEILLTDVFRLHEAIDDEIGAGGVLGYVTTTVEQMVLVHLIRLILKTKPALMKEIMFVKDGPLAFFGQTANMHKPMRALVQYLFARHDLYLAGLEKSGPFVEHADEIERKLEGGTALILDNDYIYKYIIPAKADPSNPYGRTTYYGSKVIFKTRAGGMYVASLPTAEVTAKPSAGDLKNLDVVLTNIEKLKCDMYDNALIPVALANKLVSLANHPSSKILQKFAKAGIGR
jgi:hypothetical protein